MAFNTRGPWGSFWSIFLVLLLGAWAASLWIEPIGPVYWGIARFPLLFIGLFLALLLAAATPTAHEQRRISTRRVDENPAERREEENAMAAAGVFFWVLLLKLLLAIIIGYVV